MSTAAVAPSPLASRLLGLLHEHGGVLSPWLLLTYQDDTLPAFYAAFEELKKNEWVESLDAKLKITPAGVAQLAPQIRDQTKPFSFRCNECETRGYVIPASMSDALAKYKLLMQQRPPPREDLDQTAVADEDAFIRVGFIHERGDLVNKELLMIGDFDCFSIAAVLTGLPKRAVVLELDERLVAFINKVAEEHKLPLKAHVWDVRQPIPAEYLKSFDVFSCDPVETIEGIKLYFSRGTSGLKGEGSCAYFGLTSLEAGKKKWFAIQKILAQMNYVMTDVRRNFNGYPDTGPELQYPIYRALGSKPDHLWYWAALLRIEAVDTPNPLVTGEYTNTDDIYVDDEAWGTPQDPSKQK